MWNLKPYQWIFVCCHIKIHALTMHFEWIIGSYMTVISWIGYLKNWFLMSYIYSKCWPFLYSIIKKHIGYYHQSNPKAFKYWQIIKLMTADTTFPKFHFPVETSDVMTGNKYCWLLSLRWQAHWIYLQEISTKYQCPKCH
jgi:hypothetical protein